MKNIVVTLKILALMIILTTIANACGEGDPEPPAGGGSLEELPGTIQLDEFETDEGEIGIVFSARGIARKGYIPTTAEVSFGNSGLPGQEIPFDEFNNLATISFKNSELDDQVEAQLKEGVPVEVKVKNQQGDVLATESIAKLSFSSSPSEKEVSASELDDRYSKVDLRENVAHYVQLVAANNSVFGAPASDRYTNPTELHAEVRVIEIDNLAYPSEYVDRFTSYEFKKVNNEENVYTITTFNGNDQHNLYMVDNQLRVQTKANIIRNKGNTDPMCCKNYWFRIEKTAPGMYKLFPYLRNQPFGVSGTELRADNTAKEIYFRILALDIDWDIQTIEAKFMDPILPPSDNNSEFNSTLRNCSSGTLDQNVGESKEVTTTQKSTWEESMTLASTQSSSVSLTLSTEVETSFFGSGGSTSVSATGEYEYTSSASQTSTKGGEFVRKEAVQIAVSRNVTVPPGTAISVADIYQQYENVRIPYVQRFRIYGKYQDNGNSLSGEEIMTQFAFNSFTGVVTVVADTFIEVTVRGTTIIDRLIKVTTETRDIPDAC